MGRGKKKALSANGLGHYLGLRLYWVAPSYRLTQH